MFVSLSLLLSVMATTAFAADNINKEVQASFRKEFPSAQSPSWISAGDYLKATFILDGHRTVAYFTVEGKFAGSMRSIFFDQMPLAASKAIDKKYENADVLEVYEITNDEGTNYRVTLVAAARTYKVNVDANGNISEAEKVKK